MMYCAEDLFTMDVLLLTFCTPSPMAYTSIPVEALKPSRPKLRTTEKKVKMEEEW